MTNASSVRPPAYSPSVQYLSLCFLCDELLFANTRSADQEHFKPVILEINSTQLNIFVVKYKYTKFANYYFSLLDSEKPKVVEDDAIPKKTTLSKKLLFTFNLSDKVELTNRQLKTSRGSLINNLLAYQPDIHELVATDSEERTAALQSIKGDLFKTFSMQESVDFGIATGFDNKPNTLRMIFPSHQFLIASYTPEQLIQLFYKLNVSKEVSLDLEFRSANPRDFGLPIQRRDSDTAGNSKLKVDKSSNDTASDFRTNEVELIVKSLRPCQTRFEDFKNRAFMPESFPTPGLQGTWTG